MSGSLAHAVKLVQDGRRFLLTCHVSPDADAVGSMLGLAEVLSALGKEVYLYNRDPIPETLRFLPRAELVRSTLPQGQTFDATFITDTAARSLLPRQFPSRGITGPVVILDHHLAHDDFGDVVVRDVHAPATALVVLELAAALGATPLPAAASAPLYTALVADTGGFRYPGTNPRVLRIAADLLECGVDPWRVASQVFENWSMARMRLLGLAVNTIQTAYEGRVAIVTVPLSMLDQAGATDDMAEGLVEYGRMLRGVEVAIMLWERRARAEETLEGSVLTRLSLRSAGLVDVSRVAVALGGGGHRTSAGATLAHSLAKARELVLMETGRELEQTAR